MTEQTEPSAICLKAAYRLLSLMNASPEPPGLGRLALMIDESLRYSEAISLIAEAGMILKGDGHYNDAAKEFEDFEDWARS